MNVLKTTHLEVGYHHDKHRKSIASEIEFSAGESTVTALVGANGIGKSTLLRTLSGIQKPLAGTVEISGRNIAQMSTAELSRELSVVLTDPVPAANLTVYELVALGRQPYTNWIGTISDSDRTTIDHALVMTQTRDLANQKIFEISDGQLQRVLIARAIAQDTKLIILDEPTTHLDLDHKFSLMSLLKILAAETKKCILFSTHDIELALQACDQMMVMTEESIVTGTPSALIASGAFDRLFKNPGISFDREKVKFVFKGN